MICWPVSHLLPSVNAVAIRAQEAKVAFISGPVFETVTPSARATRFLRPVNVVNVQNAVVCFSAMDALSAKFFHQGKLPTPVSRVFVNGVSVLVPMSRATFSAAKTVLALASTPLAIFFTLPPRREIAVATTILPRSVFEAILMGLERLRTITASHCDGCFLHYRNITLNPTNDNFDIACKRIEDAQRQGDMFI